MIKRDRSRNSRGTCPLDLVSTVPNDNTLLFQLSPILLHILQHRPHLAILFFFQKFIEPPPVIFRQLLGIFAVLPQLLYPHQIWSKGNPCTSAQIPVNLKSPYVNITKMQILRLRKGTVQFLQKLPPHRIMVTAKINENTVLFFPSEKLIFHIPLNARYCEHVASQTMYSPFEPTL